MFSFRNKNREYDFGSYSPNDDPDIEKRDLRKESSRHFLFESLRLLRDIFLIIVVFILIGVFFVQPVVVDGKSMEPQLHDGERLLVNKFIYYDVKSLGFGHLERGDIVVFWYPEDPNKSFVKRLIGFPGETVEVKDGKVYINGVELNEPYLDPEKNRSRIALAPVQVKNHTYYVLGDNRDGSLDSRIWGMVPAKYVYGRAFFRYWQPQRLGTIEHGEYPEMPPPPEIPTYDEDDNRPFGKRR